MDTSGNLWESSCASHLAETCDVLFVLLQILPPSEFNSVAISQRQQPHKANGCCCQHEEVKLFHKAGHTLNCKQQALKSLLCSEQLCMTHSSKQSSYIEHLRLFFFGLFYFAALNGSRPCKNLHKFRLKHVEFTYN